MNVDARQLLRRLEPAVRPAAVERAGTGRASFDRAGFDDLLARAAGGEFASGRDVDVSTLEEPLDESFAARLGEVADAAEAAGFETVLVVCDERPVLLAVGDRRLDGELAAGASETLRPVDAAVRLSTDAAAGTTPVAGPAAAAVPPAIAEAILASRPTPESPTDLRTTSPQDAPGDAA